jgi:hypothetical protein
MDEYAPFFGLEANRSAARQSSCSSKPLFEGTFGGTILHTYAQQRQWERLLASATRDKLHILNEYNRTVLHYAIEQGAPEDCCLALIQLAPNQVRVQDISGDTPVHLGCEFGMSLVVTYALLEADGTIARGRQSVLLLKNAESKTPVDKVRAKMNEKESSPAAAASSRTARGGDSNSKDSSRRSLLFMKRLSSSFPNLKPVMEQVAADFKEIMGGRPMMWKHNKDEFESVRAAVEEAVNGKTGLVGFAY